MKYFALLIFFVASVSLTRAQPGSMGIGTTTPDTTARLEVAATNKGMLIPRMTTVQRSSIAKPATGLLVYQTDASTGFYYYDGNAWYNLTNGLPVDGTGTVAAVGGALVATLAGSGTSGYADGTGTAASFRNPTGVAVDAAGNVYVADQYNFRIRKTTPAGVVTTLAGAGYHGYDDGTGTAAAFNFPTGVAVDAGGNVYVADGDNHCIRKITPAGVVTTLAGNPGSPGHADGTGTAASFYEPTGVAVDAGGNVYVADEGNSRIRKITAAGVVTTLAGGTFGYADGTGTAASFGAPFGVAVDTGGNVYVADYNNNRIRKITSGGVVTTLAGSGMAGYADGIGTAASFRNPTGVAVDAGGNVYVADAESNRIRKITAAGIVSTLAGSSNGAYADGSGTAASFNAPFGIAVDAGGKVYVADRINNRVRTLVPSTSIYAPATSLGNYATTASLNGYVATGTAQTISGAKTLTAPLLVNTTGNGNTSPLADADIQGDTIGIRNNASWDNLWFNVSGNSANINASGADSGLMFKVGVNSSGTYGNGQTLTTAMILRPNGNVGIGTLAPPSRLSIDGGDGDALTILKGGDTRIYDNAGTSSALFYTNTPSGATGAGKGEFIVNSDGIAFRFLASGIATTSDERLKQDIQPITGSLAKLQQLHGYSYRYKSKGAGSSKEVGVLAQEVQKVLPEAVYQGSDSMYSVSYTALVPLLINAVKEQQQQIVQSREEAAREKATNRQLQLRLQAIEAALKGKSSKKAAK